MGVLAGGLETVICILYVGNLLCEFLPESVGRPLLDEPVGLFRRPAVDVPSQLHGEGKLLLGGLYVADVENPDLPGTESIRFGKLC